MCVGSGLSNELTSRSEESYRVCRIVRDLETPKTRRPLLDLDSRTTENKNTECPHTSRCSFLSNIGIAYLHRVRQENFTSELCFQPVLMCVVLSK